VPLVACKDEEEDREVRNQATIDASLNRNLCTSWLSLLKNSIGETDAVFLSKRR
jgi:hypothetical protein